MASNWITADYELRRQLQAFVDLIASDGTWRVNLFTNTPTNPMSQDSADYDAPTFDGYDAVDLVPSTFGTVTVTSHVAKSVSSQVCNFTAESTASPEVVKGYWIQNEDSDLILAEEFATPITVNPNDAVNLTPELRNTNLPA